MRVCELFAGVGGFRLGLEDSGWEVVWSNQFEPGERAQWASKCYTSHFGRSDHVNRDLALVRIAEVPSHELLVGGFPCQDYSVATTKAKGIHGKKGVLWWEIFRILEAKRPPFVFLENVDRLLRSPAKQRGRDFGVMLWCLKSLGYVVEWRVVNASDYSAPQNRRRLFILASRTGTRLADAVERELDRHLWLQKTGLFATVFPVVQDLVRPSDPELPHSELPRNLQRLSDRYQFDFQNAGVMASGYLWTVRVKAMAEPTVTLSSVLQSKVPGEFYIAEGDLPKWRYLKGAKTLKRQAKNGFRYTRAEGAIPFPDPIDQPSRTIVTGEGRTYPSRFKHVICDPETQALRVLTPVECERLNQFPTDWTAGMPMGRRYFCMGNALVVGLVARIGSRLAEWACIEAPCPKALRVSPSVRGGSRGGHARTLRGHPSRVMARPRA